MTIHINMKEKALIRKGEVVRPTCWDTLIPYVNYLEGRGHGQMAQQVLERVFKGERVITKMIENAQRHGCVEC